MGKRVFQDSRHGLRHPPAHAAYAPTSTALRHSLAPLPFCVGGNMQKKAYRNAGRAGKSSSNLYTCHGFRSLGCSRLYIRLQLQGPSSPASAINRVAVKISSYSVIAQSEKDSDQIYLGEKSGWVTSWHYV